MGVARLDDSEKKEAKTEAKTETKETTTLVTSRLQYFPKKLSWCNRIQGSHLNSHIPSDTGFGHLFLSCFEKNGINSLANKYFAKAIQSGTGVAQTWLAFNPMLFVANASLIQQVILNKQNLVDKETGVDIQANFFGEGTIISLSSKDSRYRPLRASVMNHLFVPIHDLTKPIQDSITPYMDIIANAASSKTELDLGDLSSRIAITLIGQTQLGFNLFPEKYKSRLAKIVHEIVTSAPNPINIGLISIEMLVNRYVGKKPNLVRKLNALAKEGEKILTAVIDFNEQSALNKLTSISGDKKLKADDLVKPSIISLIKLFLVGGFETTSKAILFFLLMLADPKNAVFVAKLFEEVAHKAAIKPIETWDSTDLESLERLQAFIFEVLRLFPPFSYMRHASEKPFMLAQNIGLSKDKADYMKKINNPSRDDSTDIAVPAGVSIVTSTFDGHRDKMLYGDDAEEFNPDR